MARKKATFGTICNCEMRYTIVKFFTDNTVKFVTNVQIVPHKYCEWKDGEKAHFFKDRIQAEDVCFGLNANGYGCFVMEIPDYFDDNCFTNSKDEKESEENDSNRNS